MGGVLLKETTHIMVGFMSRVRTISDGICIDKAAEILADVCYRETPVLPSSIANQTAKNDSNTWLLKANVTGVLHTLCVTTSSIFPILIACL